MGPFSACAAAALTLHIGSVHFSAGDYNEVNPGLGISCNQYHAGFYNNSLGRLSTYLGRSWDYCAGPVCAGVLLVAVSGYNAPVVAPVPMLSVGGDWRLVMVAAPRVTEDSAAFIGFGIQRRFGR